MVEFEFFEKLSVEDKDFLLSNAKYIELPENYTLFYQGDICKDILLLDEGKVKLVIYGDLNDIVSLYDIKKGEQCIINTSSTLSNSEAIATAQTVTAIKGWLIPENIFKQLMIRSSTYQEYIFSLFSLKFNALTTLIEDIKFKRLDTRVLEYLEKRDEKIVQITHEELGLELNTSRVVISRVLKDLENKNFIKLHRKKIEIL
ncbi:Crp/Fnr family transcriptional regulator [Arcobacter sp. LA11]|uniref:Crp/Fnr family transcriptional regulator n=1 Tax=Arcobacter sp. LA11 TaxID=1898176 RepID=UPI0009338616|nr:Crp/Fnr family transcriptional regulator [Arcobacter sp. LA11]